MFKIKQSLSFQSTRQSTADRSRRPVRPIHLKLDESGKLENITKYETSNENWTDQHFQLIVEHQKDIRELRNKWRSWNSCQSSDKPLEQSWFDYNQPLPCELEASPKLLKKVRPVSAVNKSLIYSINKTVMYQKLRARQFSKSLILLTGHLGSIQNQIDQMNEKNFIYMFMLFFIV
ncbi:hypothetical protein pb186bvf_018683 [Paramecium bursaria]